MSKMAKTKGANGEREILKWFMQKWPDLGDLARNLEQTRNGGADCLCIPGIALEVKRQEKLTLPAWWEQTKQQALTTGRFPVLAYRQNHKKWFFCIPAAQVVGLSAHWGYITLTDKVFAEWFEYRMKLNGHL